MSSQQNQVQQQQQQQTHNNFGKRTFNDENTVRYSSNQSNNKNPSAQDIKNNLFRQNGGAQVQQNPQQKRNTIATNYMNYDTVQNNMNNGQGGVNSNGTGEDYNSMFRKTTGNLIRKMHIGPNFAQNQANNKMETTIAYNNKFKNSYGDNVQNGQNGTGAFKNGNQSFGQTAYFVQNTSNADNSINNNAPPHSANTQNQRFVGNSCNKQKNQEDDLQKRYNQRLSGSSGNQMMHSNKPNKDFNDDDIYFNATNEQFMKIGQQMSNPQKIDNKDMDIHGGMRHRDLSLGNQKVIKKGIAIENNFLGRSDGMNFLNGANQNCFGDKNSDTSEQNGGRKNHRNMTNNNKDSNNRNYNKPWLVNASSNKDIVKNQYVSFFFCKNFNSMLGKITSNVI